jgi:glycosyltransferase involved in cell wall biosynthesis
MTQPGNGRPIRVVVLAHAAELSGAELGLLRILPYLRDVRPYLLLAEDGPLVDRVRRIGVAVEVAPMNESARGLRRERVGAARLRAGVATVAYSLRLARRLRRLRPDVVHVNSLKALIYGSAAANLARAPVLWHAHDRITRDYLPASAVRLVRSFARLATVVVANSESTRTSLGSAASRAIVIPYAVVPAGAGARNGSPGRPARIGMVGRISPWKGQHVFLEAFARAFAAGDEQGVIVGAPLFGETEYQEGLFALAQRLGIDGRVEFRGFRDDVHAELARLDVLVHASIIPEPFGQVVAEGMAAGLPVVAAGAGGPAEIVDDGTTGLLFPPGDAAALASRLRSLAEDADLRRRIGEAARASTARFAPEHVAAQMTAAYRLASAGARS